METFINHILEYILGGSAIAALSSLITMRQIKKKAELENEESAIDNLSKVINEYQDYIEQLKKDREEAISERNKALLERDDYKRQTAELWQEINELKRKIVIIEGQLAKATLLLMEHGVSLDDNQ